jgi:hypothetical protein
MPDCDRRSVKLRNQFDCADDAGVQSAEILSGDPVFQDGLAADLADFVAVQEDRRTRKRVTYPAPECRTFQSRAIMVAYRSFSTG